MKEFLSFIYTSSVSAINTQQPVMYKKHLSMFIVPLLISTCTGKYIVETVHEYILTINKQKLIQVFH